MHSYLKIVSKNFVDPTGTNKNAILELISLITSELVDSLSRTSTTKLLPDELSYKFEGDVFNKAPLSTAEIIKHIRIMLDHSMNACSPYYIGHMDSMSTIYSILGDMVASAINNNMFSLEMSPFLTQLEYKIINEFCHLFGYSNKAGGLILGGGSLANLQALVVARNHALQSKEGNVRATKSQLVIFCSELAHVSIKKSAMIMGLGAEGILPIPVNNCGQMNTRILEQKINECIEDGNHPMTIVATAGTTVTGNIDKIKELATISAKYNIWLHVDAIWGGGLILSGRHRKKLEGIYLANSITFNPQKWMMIAKTCSLVLFKEYNYLEEYFRVRKNYVREQNIATDLSEVGLVGTKRADVLKLWLSIKGMGKVGYEQFIDHTMDMIEYFTECALRRSYLRIAYPPETAMICIRAEPTSVPRIEWNEWNSRLQEFLLKKNNTFVSLPKIEGENWLRIVLLNPYLNSTIIDNVFNFIDSFHVEA